MRKQKSDAQRDREKARSLARIFARFVGECVTFSVVPILLEKLALRAINYGRMQERARLRLGHDAMQGYVDQVASIVTRKSRRKGVARGMSSPSA